MRAQRARSGLAVLVFSLAVSAAAAAPSPVPVSPGSAEKLSPVGDGCPTFSWTAGAEALGYEIVVLASEPDPGGSVGEPALRERLPAGATSWTPAADRCLDPGTYAWSVRAEERGGPGPWSEASLFQVLPSAAGASATGSRRDAAEGLGRGVAGEDGERARPPQEARAGGGTTGEAEAEPLPAASSRRREGVPVPPYLAARRAATANGAPPVQEKAAGASLLHVAGDVVSAGDYGYAQPRNTVLELSPYEFVVRDGDEEDVWDLSAGGFGFIASIPDGTASVNLVAPITDPPNGATVTVFSCDYMDDNEAPGTEARLSFKLRRRLTGSSSSEIMATVSEISSGGGTEIEGPFTVDITGAVIDTDFFTYWVEGRWSQDAVGSSIRFYGCTVIFRVPALEP